MKPSVIFMGTPEFAVPSLEALIKENFSIKLVVTQPDRPAGRGQRVQAPSVKTVAQAHQIPVYQPTSLRSTEAQEILFQHPCDFLVVAAFGQILPKAVLDFPRVAPLNVHASLLPAYRGAAPIARSILEGEVKTGITIQWMIEALDQGDILTQIPTAIHEDDTAQTLHDRLKFVGAQALLECLSLFDRKQIVRRSQDSRIGSYAPKLRKDESKLLFDENAFHVHRQIMGLNPWPVAECRLAGKVLRVFKSRFFPRDHHSAPGTVVDISDGAIVVACRDGCVGLMELQLESRKRLSADEFLRGHPIPKGLILGDV